MNELVLKLPTECHWDLIADSEVVASLSSVVQIDTAVCGYSVKTSLKARFVLPPSLGLENKAVSSEQ